MKINFYILIIFLSVIVGMIYIYIQLKKENIKTNQLFLYFFMFLPFSLVFGKLYTVFSSLGKANIFSAGLSSYGGFIGIIIASIIFDKIASGNQKFIKYSIISLPLIYSISKIACWVVGCCSGIPYNGPLHIININGLAVFPVQAFESILAFLIFIFIHHNRNKTNIIYITLVITSIFKFFVEYLRYSNIGVLISSNQIFSILLFICTIIMWIIHYRKGILKEQK